VPAVSRVVGRGSEGEWLLRYPAQVASGTLRFLLALGLLSDLSHQSWSNLFDADHDPVDSNDLVNRRVQVFDRGGGKTAFHAGPLSS
jgi:hypothetical protein